MVETDLPLGMLLSQNWPRPRIFAENVIGFVAKIVLLHLSQISIVVYFYHCVFICVHVVHTALNGIPFLQLYITVEAFILNLTANFYSKYELLSFSVFLYYFCIIIFALFKSHLIFFFCIINLIYLLSFHCNINFRM